MTGKNKSNFQPSGDGAVERDVINAGGEFTFYSAANQTLLEVESNVTTQAKEDSNKNDWSLLASVEDNTTEDPYDDYPEDDEDFDVGDNDSDYTPLASDQGESSEEEVDAELATENNDTDDESVRDPDDPYLNDTSDNEEENSEIEEGSEHEECRANDLESDEEDNYPRDPNDPYLNDTSDDKEDNDDIDIISDNPEESDVENESFEIANEDIPECYDSLGRRVVRLVISNQEILSFVYNEKNELIPGFIRSSLLDGTLMQDLTDVNWNSIIAFDKQGKGIFFDRDSNQFCGTSYLYGTQVENAYPPSGSNFYDPCQADKQGSSKSKPTEGRIGKASHKKAVAKKAEDFLEEDPVLYAQKVETCFLKRLKATPESISKHIEKNEEALKELNEIFIRFSNVRNATKEIRALETFAKKVGKELENLYRLRAKCKDLIEDKFSDQNERYIKGSDILIENDLAKARSARRLKLIDKRKKEFYEEFSNADWLKTPEQIMGRIAEILKEIDSFHEKSKVGNCIKQKVELQKLLNLLGSEDTQGSDGENPSKRSKAMPASDSPYPPNFDPTATTTTTATTANIGSNDSGMEEESEHALEEGSMAAMRNQRNYRNMQREVTAIDEDKDEDEDDYEEEDDDAHEEDVSEAYAYEQHSIITHQQQQLIAQNEAVRSNIEALQQQSLYYNQVQQQLQQQQFSYYNQANASRVPYTQNNNQFLAHLPNNAIQHNAVQDVHQIQEFHALQQQILQHNQMLQQQALQQNPLHHMSPNNQQMPQPQVWPNLPHNVWHNQPPIQDNQTPHLFSIIQAARTQMSGEESVVGNGFFQ